MSEIEVVSKLLLTETEAQEMLSIGRTSLRKFRETGELIPLKLGTSVRYRKQDIEDFIAKKSAGQQLRLF